MVYNVLQFINCFSKILLYFFPWKQSYEINNTPSPLLDGKTKAQQNEMIYLRTHS